MKSLIFAAGGILLAALLLGCDGYALQGRVVEGMSGTVQSVPADDPRMDEEGVGDVEIHIYRDPGGLAEERIARGTSRPDGSFEIELPVFGAGWMDEQWRIRTRRPGYRNAEAIVRLPRDPQARPLLITLTSGEADPIPEPEDLMREYERYR